MNKKWVAGWGAACTLIHPREAEYFKDTTFRYVIHPSVSGTGLRLHFSNRYNTEAATVTKAAVAFSAGEGAIVTESLTPITFGGKESLTMAAGEEQILSDEIPFCFKAGQELMIILYFADMTQARTGHYNLGPYIQRYYARGDYSAAEKIPAQLQCEGSIYCFLHTIDFATDPQEDVRAIIAFGDSITAQPWPDILVRRFEALGITNRTVVRKGISGNRVLREHIHCARKRSGVAGIQRFERDVVQAGVDRVFVLHGINDLIHPKADNPLCPMSELPTAEELIEKGYKRYIQIAHDHQIKIYLGTLLPCGSCKKGDGSKETIRLALNHWIRTQTLADGVIDFEAAVWDPDDHQSFFPLYDRGDHTHPSLDGAQVMADCIPEAFLR